MKVKKEVNKMPLQRRVEYGTMNMEKYFSEINEKRRWKRE